MLCCWAVAGSATTTREPRARARRQSPRRRGRHRQFLLVPRVDVRNRRLAGRRHCSAWTAPCKAGENLLLTSRVKVPLGVGRPPPRRRRSARREAARSLPVVCGPAAAIRGSRRHESLERPLVRRAPLCPRQVPVRRRREALRPRGHLRHVPPERRRRAVSRRRRPVAGDFAAMAAAGFNAVRTYTVPPRWLLDVAADHGLRVMVGLPWEQHVAFLDEPAPRARDRARACATASRAVRRPPRAARATRSATRSRRRSSAGTAPRAVERFLARLYDAAKDGGPGRARHLRQLSRRPSTSSCRSSTSLCFNVYLESRDRLEAYLARLQNLAGDRPLVWPRSGSTAAATARRRRRARSTGRSRTAFAARRAPGRSSSPGPTSGTAAATTSTTGTSASSRRDRAAEAGARRGRATRSPSCPSRRDRAGRAISVVVCSYNGARTIRDMPGGLARARLPGLRGDRRRRRLDRRHRRDRARVRRAR